MSSIKDKLRAKLLQGKTNTANTMATTAKPAEEAKYAKRDKPTKVSATNALNKLMGTNKKDQADTKMKKQTTIKGMLNTITLHEDRKCDDFERYLHRLHGRVVREITRKLQEHGQIKVQLQIDAHYDKLKPKA